MIFVVNPSLTIAATRKVVRFGLALALALLTTPAVAQSPRATETALRPAQTPLPARPLRDPGSDLTLSSPGIARRPLIATPRYNRDTGDAVAECRRACAAPLYACRSDGAAGGCSARWAQCQNACRTADVAPR